MADDSNNNVPTLFGVDPAFWPFGGVLRPAGRWRGLQACNAYAGVMFENQCRAKTEPDCFLIRFLVLAGVNEPSAWEN